jgi:3',5'-nucleoside bisphosphate phosphatase
MSWLDLHLHSAFSSDGEYSPRELLSICMHSGVKVAALADHNSTRGVEDAAHWANLLHINLIPAIELDCTFQNTNLHVLGYWIHPAYDRFSQIEEDILQQEQEASQKRISLVRSLGIPFNLFTVLKQAKNGVVTGEMIAESAMELDRNKNNPLLSPYYPGGSRSDNPYVNFYWDFCSQGKPAYAPVQYISLTDAVKVIQQSGGIAILAHPGNNIKENTDLLNSIAAQGICGIEAYSSYHTAEQTAFYCDQAKRLGLTMSCGSDFHGKTKPKIKVGCVECDHLESELLSGLLEKRNQVHKSFD